MYGKADFFFRNISVVPLQIVFIQIVLFFTLNRIVQLRYYVPITKNLAPKRFEKQ